MADVLNLDELYGLARPITVIQGGREYELQRPEAFGPVAMLRLDRLQQSIARLRTADGDPEAQAQELDDLTTDLLAMLNPDLAAAGLSYLQRRQVIAFWDTKLREERQAAEGQDPKAAAPRTGAKSTRSSRSGITSRRGK